MASKRRLSYMAAFKLQVVNFAALTQRSLKYIACHSHDHAPAPMPFSGVRLSARARILMRRKTFFI